MTPDDGSPTDASAEGAGETPAAGATGQVLELEGVFRLRVPAAWSATGLDGHRYRLRAAGVDASIDVSVHRGTQPAPDAGATVRAHARTTGGPADIALVPLHGDDEPTAQRAGARWSADDAWHVVAALCRGRDVVLAVATAGDVEARGEVERVVTTLEGVDARRSRWWRRAAR